MIINTVSDLVDVIKLINTTSSVAENATNSKFIQTEGLAKFKNTIYEVLQYVDNNLSIDSLSQGKKDLFHALNSFSAEQRSSLSNSMLTSYYTPDYIVNTITEQINEYLNSSNLTDISILEPSAGSGKFIPSLINNVSSNQSRFIDAVEIDYFTSKILKNNFKSLDVNIHNMGFENFKSKNQYDLIVGNVPFGKYQVYDADLTTEDRNLINGKIHNYFFLKSVQNLKPGGILFLITTASTGNSVDDKPLREYLMAQTNLISCVRFDENTFQKSGTREITDLIVLQKPLEPKNSVALSNREMAYINVVPYAEERFSINQFFSDYPDNLLGSFYVGKGYLGKDTLLVKNTSEDFQNTLKLQSILKNDLNKYALKTLLDIPINPDLVTVPVPVPAMEHNLNHQEIIASYPLAKPGNMIVLDNKFYKVVHNPDKLEFLDKLPFKIDVKHQTKLYDLIIIRDNYKNLLEAVRNNEIEKAFVLQRNLDNLYNSFTFFNDNINSKANALALSYDVEADLLRSLEIKENNQYVKAAIFSKDFSVSNNEIVSVSSIEDAIALSYHNFGKLNEDYISTVYNSDFEFWVKEALDKELLFINPLIKNFSEIEKMELAIPSRFASGYIEGKLAIYNNANLLLKNNKYGNLINKQNIDSAKKILVQNIPVKLTIAEINPNLGEPWVDLPIYKLFAQEHFQDEKFSIEHLKNFDTYKISGGYSAFASSNYSVESNRNVDYKKIFAYAMEHNIPEYTKKIFKNGQEIKVADKETINAVNLSIKKMNDNFTSWLLSKPDFCKILENKYHLHNNAIVKENFNISLLNFDNVVGMNPYEHQKNAVWQNITQMGGILDHEVGFGKTLTMAMTTMKKRQFNLINKELVVGMNANYKNIYQTYTNAFPEGKFLLVTPDDVAPKMQQQTFYKIANNDWDAIITAHSCLMKFPIAPYSQKEILGEIISDIKKTLSDHSGDSLFSQKQINDLNKKLLNAEAEFKYASDIINGKKEKGFLIFDDLGINSLTIDESHEFKNLEFSTKHSRVAGLGNQSEVQKTRNLLSYVRFVQKQHGGDKGVTFASGTTISNSITELFLLFKYLCPSKLTNMNMETFDQWARVYARKTNEYEESVTGMIKQKERFRYFVKVPELAKIYNDITNYADINTFNIDRPKAEINLIPIEPYKQQLDYFHRIQEFGKTKDISFLHGKEMDDPKAAAKAVGLICTNEGKKASLSLKMIDPSWPDNPSDKINTMVSIVNDVYFKFDSHKGTQLLFCDQGVPGGVNFNIYAYTKNLLVAKGIPADEIAFIHSYDKKRQLLYDKVNNGEIRILLGSTAKMGVGVNVQEKIVAMHHLDYPWRPTDMVQRNGRGERPGNKILPLFNNKIPIYFYATKSSTDSYIFNLLQIKQNFIQQIKNASINTRTIDEGLLDSKGNMNYAEYMAACSNNQFLTQRLEVEKKLNLALDIQTASELQNRKSLNRLSFINSDIEKAQNNITAFSNDAKLAMDINPLKFDNIVFNTPKDAANFLRSNLNDIFRSKNFAKPLATFNNDFKLIALPKVNDFPISNDNYKVLLETPSNFKIGFKSNLFTKEDNDVANYHINCIKRIDNIIVSEQNKLNDALQDKKIVSDTLANKIDKSNEIKALKAEIEKLDVLIEKENKKNNPNDENKNKPKGPKL